MANVIQCDVCGVTLPVQDSKYIKVAHSRTVELFNVTVENKVVYPPVKKDLCESCHEKIEKFLGGEADVIPRHHEAITECTCAKHSKSE